MIIKDLLNIKKIRFSTRIPALMAVTVLMIFGPTICRAAYNEQMAVDPVSIALGNTVTARPPGIASIHFNPAGLTKLPEGKLKGSGLLVVQTIRKVTTYPDSDFDGFMNTYGPGPGQEPDPLWGVEGKSTSTDLFLPIKGPIHFSPVMAMPQSAQAYTKPGSRWSFARGVVSPFSGGFSHKQHRQIFMDQFAEGGYKEYWRFGDPNMFFGKEVYHQRINYLAPGAGFKVSDTFSVGISAAAGMTNFGVKGLRRSPSHMTALTRILGKATKDLNIPIISQETFPPPFFGGGINPWVPVMEIQLRMNDWFSPTYNFGMLWEPNQYFSLGAVYQSPIRNEMTGQYKFTYSYYFQSMVKWYGSSPLLETQSAILDLPTHPVPYQKGVVTTEYQFPQRIQAGIMLSPIKKLRLLCDVHWADWSVLQEMKLHFDQDIQALKLAKLSGHTHGNRAIVNEFGLHDTFHWSYGLEFDVSPALCLRFGYEDRQSSVEITDFSLGSLPDMKKYGIGLGLKNKEGASIDVGYSYADTGDYWIPAGTSQNLNSYRFTRTSQSQYAGSHVKFKFFAHIFSLGITKPVTVPEETAVRKKEKFKKLKQDLKFTVEKIKSSINPFKKQ